MEKIDSVKDNEVGGVLYASELFFAHLSNHLTLILWRQNILKSININNLTLIRHNTAKD